MTQRERSRQAWAKWRGLVSEQARSGQTVAAFCRERKLCAPHFFWWKKRLARAAAEECCEATRGATAQQPPRGPRGKSAATRFLEVQVVEPSAQAPTGDARIEVRLRNGRSLIVGRGFDAEQVRALLAVVEAAG